MFRVTFLVDDPAERQRLATALRSLTMGGDAQIVSAFADAKTVEAYLDIAESSLPDAVAQQFAHQLGLHEYEVTRVEPLRVEAVESASASDRRRIRRAAITQVRVHPDGRTLSVQARHRPYETVVGVEFEQTNDSIAITVLVGTPDGDARDHYVSLAFTFTWVDTFLDRPVGDRKIIRCDPDNVRHGNELR